MSYRLPDDQATAAALRERVRRSRAQRKRVCSRCGGKVKKNKKTGRPYTACELCRERHSLTMWCRRQGTTANLAIWELMREERGRKR